MHVDDALRLLEQHLGGPQRIVQVGASGFQLGGEAAVEHDGPGVDERLERTCVTHMRQATGPSH